MKLLDSPGGIIFDAICEIMQCDIMYKLLILASISSLVDPFTIITGQPIKIDPQTALPEADNPLRAIRIDHEPEQTILDVRERSHRVGVPIDGVHVIRREESLIVLVLVQLASHHQPAIRVCVEFLVVLDARSEFDVHVGQGASLCGRESGHFVAAFYCMAGLNYCLHLLSGPQNKYFVHLASPYMIDFPYCTEIRGCARIVPEGIFSTIYVQTSRTFVAVSAQMLILSVCCFGEYTFVAELDGAMVCF